ncbi:hypothetical protein HELRODRAFT_174563 [Helobdella robusta]|uniref:Endonuclease/exonuclease/phosphatase domain-containing protein n=1 Tax=Helobdella robusta TaxID=6412 RepID=T1F893_HELRO|nr:hypothetical protein HELRODRAFT_174563 [Helobdella robusta]ESO01605.1 hypothetical protein HELRODRAFT_174563 [Helobdella robusta]
MYMCACLWYRVRRISGNPVHEVVVQGPVDGLATGTPLYSVAVQGTIDGRTTCRSMGWRFGTWNVGTLTGRSLEVVEELQRRMVDVAALQEIRWKGEGTRFVGAKGGRYKLWWKGDDGTGGVGVMVREELVEKVLEVRRRSNGVIVVVMVFGKVIVRVISGYAPQQSRKEEENDRFYDDISDEIGQTGLDEFVVLLGDLNGHVGADADEYEEHQKQQRPQQHQQRRHPSQQSRPELGYLLFRPISVKNSIGSYSNNANTNNSVKIDNNSSSNKINNSSKINNNMIDNKNNNHNNKINNNNICNCNKNRNKNFYTENRSFNDNCDNTIIQRDRTNDDNNNINNSDDITFTVYDRHDCISC